MVLSRPLPALLALLALPLGAAEPVPPPAKAPAKTTTAPNNASRLTPQQLEAIVREISVDVERIRRLKFKTPVSMKVIDGMEARANFKAKVEPKDLEEARYAQDAFVHLGLVPPGTDLLRNYLDNAEKDVLGYYDSETKELYLLSHVAANEVRGVIAHELTHALEDQHYDFLSVKKKAKGDDHSTAISSVIEGSAMVVMFAFVRHDAQSNAAVQEAEEGELRRSRRLKGAPSFVQQTVMLPYLLGFSFLLRGKPWDFDRGVPAKDLEGAYLNPPLSTRQVIHPEQYWWGQTRRQYPAPQLPDLSATIGPGWSKVAEGSIGELGLAVLTGSKLNIGSAEAFLPSRWTNVAASGTVGDVYQHYVNGDKKLTALLTSWETGREAQQFDQALVDRGRYFMRYGAHVIVLAGDVGDKGREIATAAMQAQQYWAQ